MIAILFTTMWKISHPYLIQGIENLFCSLCLSHPMSPFPLSLCVFVSDSLSLILAPSPCLSFSQSSLSLTENHSKISYHVHRYFCELLLLKFCYFSHQRYAINRANIPIIFLLHIPLSIQYEKKSILSWAFISFKLVTLMNIL